MSDAARGVRRETDRERTKHALMRSHQFQRMSQPRAERVLGKQAVARNAGDRMRIVPHDGDRIAAVSIAVDAQDVGLDKVRAVGRVARSVEQSGRVGRVHPPDVARGDAERGHF